MRRRTKLVLAAGGATAAVAGGAIARGRHEDRGPEVLPPHEAIFTAYAPGGRYAFWANGPMGWLMARLIPVLEAGVHRTAAALLDLQPDDELLDIGCGPGAFLAARARHVRRVVGLDTSATMLHAAERRLADRIAAGTARLVAGNAAELPFADGEFTAVSAIFAPVDHAEAFRVLRPGGRLVFADPDPRRSEREPAAAWGTRRYSEADHRRMFEEAGFADIATRFRGGSPFAGELFVSGRRPATS